jgi:NAD(P)-dependent dehydrogenase (short-subunit alcohol dehydrogenase family)
MAAMRFDGRVVLVTGAGRGIGREYALLLAARGARVVISDKGADLFGRGADESPANEVVDEIRAAGGEAVPYAADLMTETAARGAVRHAVAELGRIDGVIHNAGFTLGGRAFEDESLDRLDTLLAINTRAAYALAQEAWPHFQAQGHGRLVLTSSAALHGMPKSIPYSTAKASLVGLMRGLAAEGASHGIRVNAVEPAAATRMAENMADSEFRSWFLATLRPELIAPVVAALVADDCPVNGELIVAGGGRVGRTLLCEVDGWIDPELGCESVRDRFAELLAQTDHVVLRDGAHAMEHNARVLGYRPTGRDLIEAGATPSSAMDGRG